MANTVFLRADSTNLPNVDMTMVWEFLKNSDKHNVAEIRGVKALMSSRESYIESAIGYAEVRRSGSACEVRAKVVPEHKLSSKYYTVTAYLNESDNTITDTSCDGCAAAAGGCKHTLLLVYWLQKRSEAPSSTSVQCYWVKPSLKSAGQEVLSCKEIFNIRTSQIVPKYPSVLENYRAEASKHACSKALILMYDNGHKNDRLTNYCIFDMAVNFLTIESDHSFENFKIYIDAKVADKIVSINNETMTQVYSKLWHCLRQARITGSKIFEIAHCKTPHGSLVEELLGGHKTPETKAMKRGKILEKRVLKRLQEELKETILDAGFMLVDGLFGASPDGIGRDFVVEIKCPISDKTQKKYLNNGQLPNKCMGQVQLEMLAAGKKKCWFCVADSNFENNGKIEKIEVNFDEDYINNLMEAAKAFWKANIFPMIVDSALT